MKKKAIKIATASVVAASSFAAVAPFSTEAASSVPSTVAKAVKSMKAAKTAYKSLGDKGKVASVASVQKAVNQAKADYSKAKAALAKYKGKDKSKLNKQLMAAMPAYHNATAYISTVKYAQNIKKQADSFAAAAKAGKSIDASSYAKFKTTLSKAKKYVMDKIVGYADQAVVKAYITPALAAQKTVDSYLVSVKSVDEVVAVTVDEGSKLEDVNLPKEVTVTLVNGKKAQKAVTWDTKELEANLSKPGEYTVKGAVAGTKLEASVKVTVKAVNPKVESVSAINAKQVEVKFNKAIDEDSVLDADGVVQNIGFTTVGTAASTGELTGELSEDGKTLTITAANTFKGDYAVATTDKAIKSADGVALDKYTTLVHAEDKEAPKLVSSSASAKVSTNKISLVFNEPVQSAGAIVTVNGEAATVSKNASNPNQLDVTTTSAIAAGTTANVKIINVQDYANNYTTPNPLEVSVVVVADTVAPNVVSVKPVGENKLEVKFDKNMSLASFANHVRLVAGSGTVTNLTATAGSDAKTVILTGSLSYTDSYSALLFIDSDVKDTAGNNVAAYSTSVVFSKDNVAPTLTSVEYKNGKLSAKFSENIAAGGNTTVTAINQATGVSTTITLNYTASTGNAVISGDTLTVTQGLVDGTYQLRLPANTVVDLAGSPNQNALIVKDFVVKNDVAGDNTAPTVTQPTGSTVTPGAPGVEQTVTYTAADAGSGINLATVRDLNNYTWDGKALPADSYVTTVLTGTADKATSVAVTVHIPSNKITATKTAAFTINGIRDNAGNTITAVGTGNVTLADGVKPEFTSAAIAANGTSLVLGFSEAVTGVDKADFVFTLNGVTLPAANLATISVSNTEPNKYVTNIVANVEDNDTTVVGKADAPKDVLYIDTNGTPGLQADDLILTAVDPATYASTDTTTTINLNAAYVSGLKVKFVEDKTPSTATPVKDTQGNAGVYNKEIVIK
ncbi:Ig-like domain-containing protein [Neobacillus sp. OS1-32]|uniref:Ig-like domain-containing protein n=1 Tax=Neobacillus sp. OS1-32 TaxID=3070682 RepID=UPI0027DEF30A|nr:Ig-like domain-containing protein [Neobacillus sp. OS1-32]WML29631.1 Ig-like domain-containing protein [Neobacillus sp. OS1-32]